MFSTSLSRLTSPAAMAVLATLGVALLIAGATLTPLPRVVSVGGGDKLHHLIGFAALALPISLLRPRWLPVAVVGLAAYGGAIELIQPLVGRSCEFADWIADLAGIGIGAALGLVGNRLGAWVLRSRTA